MRPKLPIVDPLATLTAYQEIASCREPSMLTVHLRINDRATNRPVPVRLRVVAQMRSHAPHGRSVELPTQIGLHVALQGNVHCYIDGTCEIRLPAGPVMLEISKGCEYAPLVTTLPLAAGQISLRLAIDRWIDFAALGWFAGDMRCHELSPHAALLETMCEGLNITQLLVRQSPGSLANLAAFSGTVSALSQANAHVVVNTFNHHPTRGSVSLLDTHRPVFPLIATPEQDWSIADWCDQGKRKTGLAVWADPRENPKDRETQCEALACAILGKIDAYEVTSIATPEPENLSLWYRLLDAGIRLTLVGSSGKADNQIALGAVRTYAQLLPGEVLSAATWIAAIRAGRTFVTTAPLMQFAVNDQPPGSVIEVEPGRAVRVRVEVQSHTAFDQIELISGSDVVASKTASGNRQSAILETDFTPKLNTYLVARCTSGERLPTGQCVFAQSSPIWLRRGPGAMVSDPAAVEALYRLLHEDTSAAAQEARGRLGVSSA
jgi:hypothetical protein